MTQTQLLTGMRPVEVTLLRGCDINTSGRVWEYVPASHKTEHQGRSRIVFIGPKAQAVVQEFLKPNLGAYLFSPADARKENLTPKLPDIHEKSRSVNPGGNCKLHSRVTSFFTMTHEEQDAHLHEAGKQALEDLKQTAPSPTEVEYEELACFVKQFLEIDRPGFPLHVFPSTIRRYLAFLCS